MGKTYTQVKKDFLERYKDELEPLLELCEKERLKRLRFLFATRLAVLAIIIFHIITYKLDIQFIAIFILIAIGGGYLLIKKTFEFKIRQKVMPVICECFDNLKWKYGEYNQPLIFSEANLINSYDNYYFEDVFFNTWNKTNIEIIDTHLSKKVEKKEVRIFDGIVLRIKININFCSHTIIQNNSMFHYAHAQSLEKIKFEENISKKFSVFSNNEDEARYLVTQALIERLDRISQVFECPIYSASFYKQGFYLAFNFKKHMFSFANLNISLKDMGEIALFLEELLETG